MKILKILSLTFLLVFCANLSASAQCIICPPDDDMCLDESGNQVECSDPGGGTGGGGTGGGGTGGGGTGGGTPTPIAQNATAITTQSFNANWSIVLNATKYYLDVAETASFETMIPGYNNLEITGAFEGPGGDPPPTVYSVFNITPGKDYFYRVRAEVNESVSSSSNTIQATTNIAIPSKIQENSKTTTSFKARWGVVAGAVSYRLDVSKNSGFTNILSNYNNKSVSGTNSTVSGLTPGRKYYYRVRAVGEDKTSDNSDYVVANTFIDPPTALEEGGKTNTQFIAKWQSEPGAESYLLYVSDDVNFTSHLTNYDGFSTTNLQETISGLDIGTKYYYRLKSVGKHITSSSFSSTITANTSIAKPTNVSTYNRTLTSFDANWTNVTGAISYKIQVSDDSGFSNIVHSEVVTNSSAVISGLDDLTTYYYRVRSNGPGVSSGYTSYETVFPVLRNPDIEYVGSLICSGDDPGLISGDPAIGGDGSYAYQWEYFDGIAWQPFSNSSNTATFDPTMAVSADLKVRRLVTSAGIELPSTDLDIPVYQVINEPGTLAYVAGAYCPGEDVNFTFSVNVNVDSDNTFLEVLRRGVWVNLGNITNSKSTLVGKGDVFRVRYEQPCSESVYSNQVSPDLRTDCIEPPSSDQNFVRVEVPRVPISTTTAFASLSETEKSVNYSYQDGVGRPTMTISANAAQNGDDVVRYYVYDNEGRQSTSYIPYTTSPISGGEFRPDPVAEQSSFYNSQPDIANDTHPYSVMQYDNYGRVKSVLSPGQDWHNANKKTNMNYFMYQVSMNGTVDEVKRWVLGTNGKPEISSVYVNNWLSISEVISPDGRKSQTITNSLGLPVATRKWDGSAWNTTYNVYDDYGRLRFVIAPKMANETSLTDLQVEGFLFEQRYDDRGRVKESRSPGAGWNYVVYDEWNRPVMTRHDGQTDENGNPTWTFVKFDIFGRSIMTGIIVSDKSREQMQNDVSGGKYEDVNNSAEGYTLTQSFPDLAHADFSNYELHSINYYDNYDFQTYAGWDVEGHNFTPATPLDFSAIDTTSAVLGMTTGSKVRVLGTSTWLNSVVYYDDKLRAIQLISENHLGGTDRLSYAMDWEGKVLQSLMDHQGTESVTVLSEYEYDDHGQHIQTFETVDGLNRTLVAEYNYNVLGQLEEKNIHSSDNGNTFLQSVDYRYNIRGWLSTINNTALSDATETHADLFGQQLNYTNSVTIDGQATVPSYDGNISSAEWRSDNDPMTTGVQGSSKSIYGYTYTPLNQLESADYATKVSGAWTGNTAKYSMNATYDANGNTQTLTRNTDGGALDDLSYTYDTNSNKLEAVADNSSNDGGMEDYYPGATDYGYDAMGNRTSDMNKQITDIRYNHLQMVDRIEFYDNTTINFTYTATGGKLSKEVKDGSGNSIAKVDYVGTVEYLDDEINQVFIEGGRAYKQNGAYFNEYFITDNQGNNRVAFGMLPDRFIYTATMEQSRSAYEESEFSFPANIRSAVQNHTPLGSESVALNGTVAGKEVGPAKVLNISAGDEVDMQAWARYDFTAWNNTSVANIASIVSSAFGGASAGTGGESASTALSNALADPVASGLFTGNAGGEPEAYLQYMFFDANHAYVANGSGFVAVGADAEGAFAKLETGTLTYNEPGYLFIYVVNESNQNADVFFDDLKITHSSSTADFKVSQVNEYYPYGLHTDKSWRHEGYVDPGMMYQAAYAGYDSLTGYYDFLYRSYDPALGQFFAVDPMAGTQTAYSPYHANYNNPVMYVDPLGLAPDYWPRHDSNPSSGGGSPDPGNWVSGGLGSSWGSHGYGVDYTTNNYGSGPTASHATLSNDLTKLWNSTSANGVTTGFFNNGFMTDMVQLDDWFDPHSDVYVGDREDYWSYDETNRNYVDGSGVVASRNRATFDWGGFLGDILLSGPTGDFGGMPGFMDGARDYYVNTADYYVESFTSVGGFAHFLSDNTTLGMSVAGFQSGKSIAGLGLRLADLEINFSYNAGYVTAAAFTIFVTKKGTKGRGLWNLTKAGASQIKSHKTFGTFYKSKNDGLWWSVDRAGHGGSKFKVFKQTKNGLMWYRDADQYGDFIINKHKGPTGKFIPWSQLKSVN